MRIITLLTFTVLAMLPVSVFAAVLHVPGEYDSIQSAIDAASEGDTVLVADGTYTGIGNRDIDLSGKAITVMSENGPDTCIIDCGDGYYQHRGFSCHTGETHATVITGFTVINAKSEFGAGMLCDGSSPAMSNCTFRACTGTENSYVKGGALFFKESGSIVTNCTIMENTMDSGFGGGIFVIQSSLIFSNCTITGNTAKYSGGVACLDSNISMMGCTFTNNTAAFTAGGISAEESTVVITDCEISGNAVSKSVYSSADGNGGGISITNSMAEIRDCVVRGNTAPNFGGGIYLDSPDEITISECTIQNNEALYGGGIYCGFDTLPVIGGSAGSSNTFISNFAPIGSEVYARGDGGIIDGTYNAFDGYHLSDVCVSPQSRFNLSGCASIIPVEQDMYVSPQGDDSNDGLSTLTPFRTIYRAMRVASATDMNPLTVHLLQGVYSRSETGERFPLPLADFVSVAGDGPGSVTLDAEGEYGVFCGSGDSQVGLSGITAIGGRSSGLNLTESSVVVNNCHLRENSCGAHDFGEGGGGIYSFGSDLTVQFSLIEQNESSGSGGGISFTGSDSLLDIRQSLIRDNTTHESGGGVSCGGSSGESVSISECAILNNHAVYGGGVSFDDWFSQETSLLIDRCTVNGNTASNSGGGLSLAGNWIVSGCVISENSGGGIYSDGSDASILQNCLIADNIGNGVSLMPYEFDQLDCLVNNCSMIRNSAIGLFVRLYYSRNAARIANSIIWANGGNSIDVINRENGSFDVTHCCVFGGYSGDGNFSSDPRFMANRDFHLRGGSPCVDAGTSEYPAETDLDGNTRNQGGGVDIGAYEFAGWPEVPRTYLTMSTRYPGPGDIVSCIVNVWNPGIGALDGYPLFVILDLMGELYFAPGFSDYDRFDETYPEGMSSVTVLPEFLWPDGVGSCWGAVWYAALTNPEITKLHGNWDTMMFGWHD